MPPLPNDSRSFSLKHEDVEPKMASFRSRKGHSVSNRQNTEIKRYRSISISLTEVKESVFRWAFGREEGRRGTLQTGILAWKNSKQPSCAVQQDSASLN